MEFYQFHNAVVGERKGQPVVTECIVKQDGRFARALALWKVGDKFDQDFAIKIARGRARKALEKGSHAIKPIQRQEAIAILKEIGLPMSENERFPKASVSIGQGLVETIHKLEEEFRSIA